MDEGGESKKQNKFAPCLGPHRVAQYRKSAVNRDRIEISDEILHGFSKIKLSPHRLARNAFHETLIRGPEIDSRIRNDRA